MNRWAPRKPRSSRSSSGALGYEQISHRDKARLKDHGYHVTTLFSLTRVQEVLRSREQEIAGPCRKRKRTTLDKSGVGEVAIGTADVPAHFPDS